MSWRGDPQATAPIGRKASTNVMPVLESIQNQEIGEEILALNHALKGVPPDLIFRGTLASILSALDMHQGCVFVLSMVFQFALLRGSNSSWEVVTTERAVVGFFWVVPGHDISKKEVQIPISKKPFYRYTTI